MKKKKKPSVMPKEHETTFFTHVPRQLFNEFKAKCVLEGKTIKQVTYELLRKYVDSKEG